jgi:hypothetical protein
VGEMLCCVGGGEREEGEGGGEGGGGAQGRGARGEGRTCARACVRACVRARAVWPAPVYNNYQSLIVRAMNIS